MKNGVVAYISGYLWISDSIQNNYYIIGFKDEIIHNNVSDFSLYNEKLLAIKENGKVFIYLYNSLCSLLEDALTCISILQRNSSYTELNILVEGEKYIINNNCQIYRV